MNKKYNKSESKGGAHIVRLYCMLLLEADNIDRINIINRIIIPTWLLHCDKSLAPLQSITGNDAGTKSFGTKRYQVFIAKYYW